jgi:hypothetical protein
MAIPFSVISVISVISVAPYFVERLERQLAVLRRR